MENLAENFIWRSRPGKGSTSKQTATLHEYEEELVKQLTLHTDPVNKNAETENILYELLLKSGVSLTAKTVKANGHYLANNDEIALILEKINGKLIKTVIA